VGVVDEYLATLPPEQSAAFERIREVVLDVIPDADQGTSYGMAAFTYRGRPLLAVRAWAHHLAIYPCSGHVVDAVADQLEASQLARGTVRFSADAPVPEPVLRRIVELRADEIRGGRR
jgi:uncharacterized protein YdhG (YjbR/CyaY superfamily)